jgi:hypothetical protein
MYNNLQSPFSLNSEKQFLNQGKAFATHELSKVAVVRESHKLFFESEGKI